MKEASKLVRKGKRPAVWLGKDQQVIAAEIGVAQSTISNWLRGLHEPTDEALQALSDCTGLPPAEIKRRINAARKKSDLSIAHA